MHLAGEGRQGSGIDRLQLDFRPLPDDRLIDVGRTDVRLDDQLVAVRHDQRNGGAGGDDAADRVDGKLADEARLRRPHHQPVELVARCAAPLHQLGDAGVDLAQVALGLLALDEIDLRYLKLAARDRDVRLRDLGLDLPDRAGEFGARPLQRQQLPLRGQPLGHQRLDAFEFLPDQPHLVPRRDEPCVQSVDAGLELADLLGNAGLLTGRRRSARLEQGGFGGNCLRQFSSMLSRPGSGSASFMFVWPSCSARSLCRLAMRSTSWASTMA